MKQNLLYTHFPYCIKRTEDNKKYIILNRDYKPLGTTNWVQKYSEHPSAVNIRITKNRAKELSWNHSEDTNCVYLFESTPAILKDKKAFNEYMTRLSILAKITSKTK